MEELELNKTMELDTPDIDNESENDNHTSEPMAQPQPQNMPGEMVDITTPDGFHIQLVSLHNTAVELGQYGYNLYHHWKEQSGNKKKGDYLS